jgi:hypothetical protein
MGENKKLKSASRPLTNIKSEEFWKKKIYDAILALE